MILKLLPVFLSKFLTPTHKQNCVVNLRDAKNIEAYCTCNTTFEILMKVPYFRRSVALCNASTGPGSSP